MRKLLIVCGPTASGKTSLAVRLAKKFKGELISADSRQIYKGMDIITGKDLPLPIPVWGLDVVNPDKEFSVAHWLGIAQKAINDVWKRGRLPIVVGGTGFWIKALLEGVDTLGIPPDWQLRKKLSNLDIEKLREILKRLDSKKLKKMNKSDRNNFRRLIRAIEMAKKPKIENSLKVVNCKLKIDRSLIIGLKAANQVLYQRIDARVDKRLKQGAEKEVKDLIDKGYAWNLPAMSAIGYREWQAYFKGEKTKREIIQAWKYSEHAYARRQMTFFRKMGNVNWFDISRITWQKKVEKKVKSWYY